MQSLLSDIVQIDWRKYQISDFPKWITLLLSNDINKNAVAFDRLDVELVKENPGIVESYAPIEIFLDTDAPIIALPFLLRLLKSNNTHRNLRLIEVILDMATSVDLYINYSPESLNSYELGVVKPIADVDEPFQQRAIRLFEILKENKNIIQTANYPEDIYDTVSLLMEILDEIRR